MVHIIAAYRQVIDGDLEDVPTVVIGVAIGEQTNPVFVPGQLAQVVVLIAIDPGSVLLDLGDVSHLVVDVGVGIIPIPHRFDESGGGVWQGPIQVFVPGDKGCGGTEGAGGEPGQVVVAVA